MQNIAKDECRMKKTNIYLKLTLTLFCLMLPGLCRGQKERVFSVDNQLSSNMVNSIYQDRDGVIWIATEYGLNRYDGTKFSTYNNKEEDEHSLRNDYVRVLTEDSRKRFWIGTLTGIQLYDRASDQFTHVPNRLFRNETQIDINVAAIIERADGTVMAGSSGHGLFTLTEEEGQPLFLQQDIPGLSYYIIDLCEDSDGNLWIATSDKGIQRIDKQGKLKNYHKDQSAEWASDLCEDSQGRLYAGSLTNGLLRYNPAEDRFEHIGLPANGQGRLPVKCISSAGNGFLYIGTDGEGLKTYNPHTGKIEESHIDLSAEFASAKVHAILKDRQNNLWLGLFQKGVALVPPTANSFNYIGHKTPQHDLIGTQCVMSVFAEKNGTVWVGTDTDGLYVIGKEGKRQDHYPLGTVMSIHMDSKGTLWAGTFRNGLYKLDPRTKRCQPVPLPADGKQTQDIYSIVEDPQGHLWIAAMGNGLYRIDLGSGQAERCESLSNGLEYTPQKNVLHNAWINCLCLSAQGKLYIGTYDGLGCLDLATMDFVSPLRTNRLLEGQVVYAIHEDPHHTLWIGTSKGLYSLDPATAETHRFTTDHGLACNAISSIQGDASGALWISTSYGLSRFTPGRNTFTNFFAEDGLQGNEFSKRVSCQGPDGRMYFGGSHGLTWFNPAEIINPGKKREVRICDFYLHGKTVKAGTLSGGKPIVTRAVSEADTFRLCHKDNSFSIEFSVMEFYNPERIGYSYSMNGAPWTHLPHGMNRVAFSNLQPGTYRLQVKAKDYNTFSTPKEITLLIAPPWYETPWFKLLLALAAAGIVAALLLQARQRYHTRRKMLEHIHAKQLSESKLQAFVNISHEIRTPMTLVISPLQKLMATDKAPERQREYNIIHRNAKRVLSLINQLMDVRKIDKGQMKLKFSETDLTAFVKELCELFEPQARSKHIKLLFAPEQPEGMNAWIDPDSFDKIMMNILSNAFKYTPEGGTIEVALRTAPRPGGEESPHTPAHLEVTVTDSGIGIAPEEMERIFDRFYQVSNRQNTQYTGTGIGLHLTHALVELLHGTISVSDNPSGQGCRFTVSLPLGKAHLAPEEIAAGPAKPLHQPEAPLNPAEEEPDSDGKKKNSRAQYRLLVTEDDPEIRAYLHDELAKHFLVKECANGKEAWAQILRQTPDLLISDIMMPEMDGITLCQKVKQHIHTNHLPVILLTAKAGEEDNIAGLKSGADVYMRKPFNIELLKQTAFNLIKNRNLLKNSFQGNQSKDEMLEAIAAKNPDEQLMERLMKIVNANLGNPEFTVEQMAQEAGISRGHLNRKMRELTNQSTSEFIRNTRLRQAAKLLSEKRLDVKQVTELTGFASMSYFSTAFKEQYGMSPTAWMEQERENGKA